MIFKHSSNLNFGHIACDHTYTKKLTIFNIGSIPSTVRFYWQMPLDARTPLFESHKNAASSRSTRAHQASSSRTRELLTGTLVTRPLPNHLGRVLLVSTCTELLTGTRSPC